LNLFYVKNFGTFDVTKFITELELEPELSQPKTKIIPVSETKALPGKVAFSVMCYKSFDLETFQVNLKRGTL
jgi:hypothetical protein